MLIFLALCLPLYSAEDTSADIKEYQQNEFPKGLYDFRRFEQVMFGAFPLAIFFAQMAGGVGLLIQDTIVSANGGSSDFTFGIENYSFDDKVRIIASGVGISFGIAIIDMIIYQSKLKQQQEKYRRRKIVTKSLSNQNNLFEFQSASIRENPKSNLEEGQEASTVSEDE